MRRRPEAEASAQMGQDGLLTRYSPWEFMRRVLSTSRGWHRNVAHPPWKESVGVSSSGSRRRPRCQRLPWSLERPRALPGPNPMLGAPQKPLCPALLHQSPERQL